MKNLLFALLFLPFAATAQDNPNVVLEGSKIGVHQYGGDLELYGNFRIVKIGDDYFFELPESLKSVYGGDVSLNLQNRPFKMLDSKRFEDKELGVVISVWPKYSLIRIGGHTTLILKESVGGRQQ